MRRVFQAVVAMGVGASALTGQCPSGISPSVANAPARGNSSDGATRDSFRVFGSNNCRWTAVSQVAWITISLGQTGTNNGTVGYAVQQNQTPVSRNGVIRVGDQSFTVIQAGSSCPLSLSGSGATVPAGGGGGSFRVETTCQWIPTANVEWIRVTGGGTGSGTVEYTVQANPTVAGRSGIISIYDRNFVVSQEPSPCNIRVTPASDTVPAVFAGEKTVRVEAPAGCAWTVQSAASWVRASPQSGSGASLITLRTDNNLFAEPRTAIVLIGGAGYTLRQDGAACSFALTPDRVSVPPEGTSTSFAVGTTCNYTVQSQAEWIRVRSSPTGAGSGRVDYLVEENKNPEPRTGSIRVGTAQFTVSQAARPCTVQLDPESVTYTSPSNTTGSVRVTSTTACWTAESYAPWITVTGVSSSASGSGVVTYAVLSNPVAPSRTGTIQIGPRAFSITQAGVGVFFTAEGVAHGASAQAGPVAPGEIIVIYGLGMGPTNLVTARLTPDGTALTKELAGTRVLFDGVPAAMVYTSAGQVSAVVPYAVTSRALTQVVVEYNGIQSGPVSVPVTTATPGIFTANTSGVGLGAILNQDSRYNSEVPAKKGSVVQIFATGEGETTPASVDAVLTVPPWPRPNLPVKVFIDGVQATLEYAGAAPGLVAGVLQVNARIPPTASSGQLPIQLQVGSALSRTGVTVWVE